MVIEDGTVGHLLAMCALPPPSLRLTLGAFLYRYLTAQIALSKCWALFEDGAEAPFVLCGLATNDDGICEAFFIARPGGLPGHLMVATVRHLRKCVESAGGPVLGLVIEGNPHGERLARLCGFELTAERFGQARIWRRE